MSDTHTSQAAHSSPRDEINRNIGPQRRQWRNKAGQWSSVTLHHLKRHTANGIVCSVAYFDPGNWSVDLQAGSEFRFKLLFVVLLSGIMAVIFQSMATRLGVVTGLDLATHCRMLLYNRTKHPRLCRWLILYPLYTISEIAIISTDLAELLGSATALVLLFPALPLWAGVLITASDVFIILAISDPTRGKPVRVFELLIAALVLAVIVSLAIVIAKVSPDWGDAFEGFLPSKTLFEPGAIYTSIGIIGATVMPHGLFLGSSLATQDRVYLKSQQPFDSQESLMLPPLVKRRRTKSFSPRTLLEPFQSFKLTDVDPLSMGVEKTHRTWVNNSLAFVDAHLTHGIVDIVMSLLGFAVLINALILIIASAVFFNGGTDGPADLFEAHALIRQRVGTGAALLFALALLCAGESAGITATLAGQVVSEGFIRWHISPVIRRAITRLLGLVPSMLVAVIVGREGLNTLLVASQVILSFVLPFVAFPLVWITSSSEYMRVKREFTSSNSHDEEGEPEYVDYSNGKIMMALGYIIWLVVLVANAYVIVSLAMG